MIIVRIPDFPPVSQGTGKTLLDVSTEKKISTDNNNLTKLEADLVNTSWRTTEFTKVSDHHIVIDKTMLGDGVATPFAIWTWRALRLYVW